MNAQTKELIDDVIQSAMQQELLDALAHCEVSVTFPDDDGIEDGPMADRIKFGVYHEILSESDDDQAKRRPRIDGVGVLKMIAEECYCIESLYNAAKAFSEMSAILTNALDEFYKFHEFDGKKTTADDIHRMWPGDESPSAQEIESFIKKNGPISKTDLFSFEKITVDDVLRMAKKGIVHDADLRIGYFIDLAASKMIGNKKRNKKAKQ